MAVLEQDVEAPANVKHGDLTMADGVRIHWMEAGEGTPVVLLHGYTSCCDAGWFANGVAKELARDHRVIGIDARGHGRSEKPHDPAKYPGDAMPADVIAVLDHLGVRKAHFHGYSMGGGIVAHLMARHPDRFISASFGGSGVREEDEALAKQAAERDPQGQDPQQAEGQRALRERADRDDVALECVQKGRHRQAVDRAAARPRPRSTSRSRRSTASSTRRSPRPSGWRARPRTSPTLILPGRSHNTVTTWPFTPRLYVDSIAGFVRAHDPK